MNDPYTHALVGLLGRMGIKVELGPLELTYHEHGNKTVCRVEAEVKLTIPPNVIILPPKD